MSRITTLEIENTMAIKVAEIHPNGEPITTIGGKTAQGKSTALRSVGMLFDGAKAIPDEPLRRGAKRGHIRAEIDGGLDNGGFEVERKLTRKGTSLVVTGRDGTPQALMDQIKGGCMQDLGKIARMKNAELLAVVRELVPGQDFTAHDAERACIYDERTDANRDAKRLRAQLDSASHSNDAPIEEVSVAKLAAELTRRQEINAGHETKRAELREVGDKYRAAQVIMKKAESDLVAAKAGVEVAAGRGRTLKAEVAKLEDPDTEEIQVRLATVDEANRRVRDNAEHARLTVDHGAAEKAARALDRNLEDLDEKKAKTIAEAEYPVVGLSVDDDTVMLHDFSWDQASMREKLVASAEIVLAQSPDLRELLLDEGSAFDVESREALSEWADKNKAHIWMVVVGDGKGCSVVFHEGEVVGAEKASPEPAKTEGKKPPGEKPKTKKPEVIDVDFGGGAQS
jgi:predicted NAD-dependent protein-ADP-ribosyltransferase YbiA (DUF1768 family)